MSTTKYQFTLAHTDLNTLLGAATPARESTDTRTIVADRGLSRQTTFSLLTAKFGDGYEQRAVDGINSKQEVFGLTFKNRDYKEANLIAAFFDLKKGLNFSIEITNTKDVESATPTDVHETIKVACDSYTLTYITDTIATVTSQFRRVYEP